jgi:hypothetical protein
MRHFWRNFPLGVKIFSVTSLLVIGTTLITSYLSIVRERKTFQEELSVQANLLLETIPRTIRDPLYLMAFDELSDFIGVVDDYQNITKIIIFDQYGVVLVDSDKPDSSYDLKMDTLGYTLINLEKIIL